MRFDPELMRDILLYTENRIEPGCIFNGPFASSAEERSAEINAHAKLLFDDGYFDGHYETNDRGFMIWFAIRDLTMKGHGFIANARNDALWSEVIADSRAKGLSISITVLAALLEQAVKKRVGLVE